MRLPSRSFGVLTALRLTVMKPWRKTREGNTGSANHLVAAGGEPAEDLGARHLAGIEIEIFPHAVENLPLLVDGEKVEIDTFGFDFAGMERRHAVIEAAGERDRNFGHDMTPAPRISGLPMRLAAG